MIHAVDSEPETSRHDVRQSNADLYAKHAEELVRFATVLVGPADADDLVAEAVLRTFFSSSWASVTSQRAYLYRAVLNQARQQHRSAERRRRRELRSADREATSATMIRPEVMAAMHALNHRQRAIVFFTYWQDMSTQKISDELGITQRTVQLELAAARTRLGELLR